MLVGRDQDRTRGSGSRLRPARRPRPGPDSDARRGRETRAQLTATARRPGRAETVAPSYPPRRAAAGERIDQTHLSDPIGPNQQGVVGVVSKRRGHEPGPARPARPAHEQQYAKPKQQPDQPDRRHHENAIAGSLDQGVPDRMPNRGHQYENVEDLPRHLYKPHRSASRTAAPGRPSSPRAVRRDAIVVDAIHMCYRHTEDRSKRPTTSSSRSP